MSNYADDTKGLTAEQADAIYSLLVEHVGEHETADSRQTFIHLQQDRYQPEYRLNSALGWGGKFRRVSSRRERWLVDFYSEDTTPERKAMVAAVNEALAALKASGI